MHYLSANIKIAILYISWWLVWVVVQVLVMNYSQVSWSVSVADAAITQGSMALACFGVHGFLRSYQPGSSHVAYLLIVSVVLAVLCVALQHWLLLYVTRHYQGTDFFQETQMLRGIFAWLMITLVGVLTLFWGYVLDSHETNKRKQETEKLAREVELATLRQQLQPHFLFNSLNSINALIGTDPERARTMVLQLSDFLRATVRKEATSVTFEEELQHLKLYLSIERVRFGHRLVGIVDCDPATLQMKLPSLLLQPLMENAIKFGLNDVLAEVTISLKASVEQNRLRIEITNPFDPATAVLNQGTGFGLTAVARRLQLLYAQPNLLKTGVNQNHFITTVYIPQYD